MRKLRYDWDRDQVACKATLFGIIKGNEEAFGFKKAKNQRHHVAIRQSLGDRSLATN